MPDRYIKREDDNQVVERWIDMGDGTHAKAVVLLPPGASSGIKTDRSVAASSSSQIVAPAKAGRRKLIVKNLDAAISIFVNLGALATAGAGSIEVAAKGFLELDYVSESVNVIAASGSPAVTIWEF